MRKSNSLSAAFIRTVTAHGAYSDGNGLTLRVDKSGKRWVQRVTIDSKRHNIGLGAYPAVPLAKARQLAVANAQAIREGRNPIAEKRQAREKSRRPDKPTFADAASRVIELRRPTWRNVKHAAQWSSTLETYTYPIIGKKPVDEVATADILSCRSSLPFGSTSLRPPPGSGSAWKPYLTGWLLRDGDRTIPHQGRSPRRCPGCGV